MSFFTTVAEIDRMLADLPPVDAPMKVAARTKPPGSLCRRSLGDIAIWMAGWQRTEQPAIRHGQCRVFAGNHGVVAQLLPFPAMRLADNAKSGGRSKLLSRRCNIIAEPT